MSERKVKASPEKGAQQSSPPNNGEAFQRTENLLAVEHENRDERARQALGAIEYRDPAGGPSNLTDDSDSPTQRTNGDQRDDDQDVDPADNDEVVDSLDEKARQAGVAAANDASRGVWEGTPHNL